MDAASLRKTMNRRTPCGSEYLCIDDARKPDGIWHESGCPGSGRLDSYIRHVRSRLDGHQPISRAAIAGLLDELERAQRALLQACSMLDDAVQLRDDAETWFPQIDTLRRVVRPDLPVMAGYVKEPSDGQG